MLEIDKRATQSRRGHLWMLRQDLAGFMLLGDPAARLPKPKSRAQAAPQDYLDTFFPFKVTTAGATTRRVTQGEIERAVVALPGSQWHQT